MSSKESERLNKEFENGRLCVDSGRYEEAIEIYDKIIEAGGDKENCALLESSFNNRGVAKCMLGEIRKE
ncbi:hypothetical protein [Taibaiella soli]|uniref:hypothetical protein n=1 Tax=Taibaiella soli TaxID=1649169 RepID=UPI000F4DFB68|nr:hypothetical protein [Taibaiella soli]